MTMRIKTMKTTFMRSIHPKTLGGLMVSASLLVLLACSLVYPSSSKAQTEVVTGQDTKEVTLPGMTGFTRDGKTSVGTGRGCSAGEFCTGGGQEGGTYTTEFDLQQSMTLDQINRGFTLDSSVDVKSHQSNLTVPNCVTTLQASPDCKDVFSLTIKLFNSDTAGTNLVHSFKHEVTLDFKGLRSFAFQNTVPTNEFVAMTGEFELFGIDAGFPNHSFGPSFSNPGLTTTFDLVTLIETEVIDVVNDIITDPVAPIDQPITDVQVEIQNPDNGQMAELTIEVETQMEIPNVELAPPPPPAETSTQETQETAAVEQEFNDPEPTTEASSTEPEPEPEPETTNNESESEPEPQTAEANTEEESNSNAGSDGVDNDNEESSNEQQTASNKSPKKAVAKTKAKSKQKVARKIMKKMGDKGRYDSTNQIRTLVVMQVLGNSRGFFTGGATLKDASRFYSPSQIPGGILPDSGVAGFMFNDANVGHNSLVDSQYK